MSTSSCRPGCRIRSSTTTWRRTPTTLADFGALVAKLGDGKALKDAITQVTSVAVDLFELVTELRRRAETLNATAHDLRARTQTLDRPDPIPGVPDWYQPTEETLRGTHELKLWRTINYVNARPTDAATQLGEQARIRLHEAGR